VNRQAPAGDPWRRSRVGELSDQLLPRWFVVTALVSIPVAIAALVGAFVVFGPDRVPVANRRPPPAAGLTTAVGDYAVGDSEPQPVTRLCPTLDGIRVAGTDADRTVLITALNGLCDIPLDPAAGGRLRAFADAGGVVRFAQFEATGVDSTATLQADPPVVLVNARFARTDPLWVAPLIVHDTTLLAGDPAAAETALAARRAEAAVCAELFADRRPSRGCDDARALLSLPDPLGALRAAGFD